MVLSIADLLFTYAPSPVMLRRQLPPSYDGFLTAGSASDPIVTVRIIRATDDALPSTRQPTLTAPGLTCSVLPDGGRLLALQAPEEGAPLIWEAALQPGFREVVVACGRPLELEENGRAALLDPLRYPLDQLLLMYALAQRGGLILHAAGALIDGSVVLFPGISGAGKTTVSRALAEAGAVMLSDDRMVLRERNGHLTAHGTPWPGELGAAVNAGYPVRAMVFLQQALDNRLERIDPTDSLRQLLPTASIPWHEPELVEALLDMCGRVVAKLACFTLAFTPGGRLADLLLSRFSIPRSETSR